MKSSLWQHKTRFLASDEHFRDGTLIDGLLASLKSFRRQGMVTHGLERGDDLATPRWSLAGEQTQQHYSGRTRTLIIEFGKAASQSDRPEDTLQAGVHG